MRTAPHNLWRIYKLKLTNGEQTVEKLKFDTSKSFGEIKPMNAVNNGPVHKRHAADQAQSNLKEYAALRIPYARNHDASFYANYGGCHTVDISAVFPNFDADVNDPASYDFACTDEYIAVTELSGTKTYYRLGQAIEHYVKKFHIYPPKDFKKWAEICEHIIMHYTEGWADGYNYDIEYWEIWNEPDLDIHSEHKRTWTGTEREFFDLYAITAKHLKARFPHLKIGGPALACDLDWADRFLADMRKNEVEINFFSWHIYANEPEKVVKMADDVRALLDKHGYFETESILNEWNYVRGWEGDIYKYSRKSILSIKGAIFALSTMISCQKTDVDMLMYYDARPGAFNGIFDNLFVDEKLKSYYSFLWFADMRECEYEIRCEDEPENIYTLAGASKEGKLSAVVAYYTENDDTAENKTVKLDFGKAAKFDVYLLDAENDAAYLGEYDDLTFDMKPLSAVMIKEK